MSEIQCNNITSSKKNKKGFKETKKLNKSLDAIKQIIKDSVEMENSNPDKNAILKLVKRNLQKMCLTKTNGLCQHMEQTPLSDNRVEVVQSPIETRIEYSEIVIHHKSGFDYDRSKNTKELLRKTILEKRRSFELCQNLKEKELCLEFKQKIWRPW